MANEKVMINLWNFGGIIPSEEFEIIIKRFEFSPMPEPEIQND